MAILGLQGYPDPSSPNHYGLGELGSWLFDLLGLWGQYQKNFADQDLTEWMAMMIGKTGGVPDTPVTSEYLADPQSAFMYADVLADADAWLLYRTMSSVGGASALKLSSAMRETFQGDGNQRILRFYEDRFDGNSENVAAAFRNIVNGIDIRDLNLGFSTSLVRKAAGLDGGLPLPTPDQAEECGRAFAGFLADPRR